MVAAAITYPDLLDLCVAGDRRAWRQLHSVYRPAATAFLLRLGVGPREAEDALFCSSSRSFRPPR